uniref:1-alkyl-2-acetylglycerophosphocholine esterase n=1 Tax=Aplanochytrium stocchinoi TaxID=215587 RepID=A0A6S7ZTP7_9STRA
MKFFWKLLGARGEISPPLGHARVGLLRFRFPDSAYCHIFYPAVGVGPDIENTSHPEAPYVRREAVVGLAKFLKLPVWLTSMLTSINHPFVEGAPVYNNKETASDHQEQPEPQGKLCPCPDANKFKQYPVLIFSHGLGGTAELYSKFCSDVSSHGFIVIAVEHEDGSGSFHKTKNGDKVYYQQPPNGMTYTRTNVIDFREPFLKKRKNEVAKIVGFLHKKGFDEMNSLSDLEKQVFQHIDSNSIYLGGHSFGGCSTAYTAYHFEKNKDDDTVMEIFTKVKGYVFLDIWSYPLPEEVLDKGIQKPMISILSESFAYNNEISFTSKFIGSSNCMHSSYIEGTVHQQFSDSPWLTNSNFIKRKAFMEGNTDRGK